MHSPGEKEEEKEKECRGSWGHGAHLDESEKLSQA